MSEKGKLITFEGGEGAGKSTQISLLAQFLVAQGKYVTLSREPGGTALGEKLRSLLLSPEIPLGKGSELLLHLAARCQNLEEVILPALSAGHYVLSDRFFDSTVAYQCYGAGLSQKTVVLLHNIVGQGLKPDLTILLDIDPQEGLSRKSSGIAPDRYEQKTLAFHQQVRAGFKNIAEQDPERFLLLPVESYNKDELNQQINQQVKAKFFFSEKKSESSVSLS